MANSRQLKFIDSRSAITRAAVILIALLIVAAAYYGVRRQFGQAFAEAFQPGTETAAQTAKLATDFAPGNSFAWQTFAKVQQGKTLPEILGKAVADNETAVKYSPSDYRYWLDLGRARGQNGDDAQSETALRRAVELAPNYSYNRWLLGNLLLRENKTDEAMAEFKRVAATHTALRQQVFYLVWETTDGNADEIKRLFGDTPQVRAALAVFYGGKNLPDQSVQMWQSLTAEEKEENREAGKNALRANYEKANFRAAAVLAKDLGTEDAETGKITNGGFEQDIGKSADVIFNWHIDQIKNAPVLLDLYQPKEGKRSLKITFTGYNEPVLQAAPQAVAIESGAKYRLSFAVRTADLKSAGMPVVEAIDFKTLKVLGASSPLPAATSGGWQTLAFDFTAPADQQAVLLRLSRQFCGANCPIIGAAWLDDFQLQRTDKTERK